MALQIARPMPVPWTCIDGVVGEKLLQFIERIVDGGADGCGIKGKLDFIGIELCHLCGLADEAVQAVAFLIDDGKQFVILFGRVHSAAEQRRHRGFDGSERRAKFMGDRIEQHGA
jgi:hypothetical protein